jgi:hypothetical protein
MAAWVAVWSCLPGLILVICRQHGMLLMDVWAGLFWQDFPKDEQSPKDEPSPRVRQRCLLPASPQPLGSQPPGQQPQRHACMSIIAVGGF